MAPEVRTSKQLYRHLVGLYAQGSTAAVVVVLFLVFIGLELTAHQWIVLLAMLPAAFAIYVIPDIILISRHYRPLGAVLTQLDAGETPAAVDISRAIVRALNLPYYSFLRVVLFHGPAASIAVMITLNTGDAFFQTNYEPWQVLTFTTIVLFFASPTHAIFEYFSVSHSMVPVVGRLYPLIDSIDRDHQSELRAVSLKKKLLYLAIFVTSLPLLFLAGSVAFKVNLLFQRLSSKLTGTENSDFVTLWNSQNAAFLVWVFGVVAVCMVGALIMSVLTAREVSSSAERLRRAMRQVEGGDLDVRLKVTSTDEYADLFRGFNLMTEGLHEEVKILGISQDLMGELKLDLLLERIIKATTELLDADRSTLFLHDPKTNELWSRFAEGLESREIRFPSTGGIAGSVFTTGHVENIVDAHLDPRFNADVDRRTGYRTRSMLALPVVNKSGQRIGVTQVLNKRGGPFTTKDESRLRAFTAQIAIALENAKLFDDVMRVQNYNESILRSTSNGMLTLDAERRVVTSNDATLKLLRKESADLIGANANELFAAPNDWVLDSLTNVEETGDRDIVVDAELQLPWGEMASVNLTAVPLIDAKQVRIGSLLILEDISIEKRMKGTMSRYVSKEVAEQLLESGEIEGKLQKVSILFSDIRDFTTVSESIGARGTVSMLNEYFTYMVDVIDDHTGMLNKFIGDAIMALFGAALPGPDDANKALRTATDMIVKLRELNAHRQSVGLAAIRIGVGVNTGDVVLGTIGSPKRQEYTAIGDPVNLASRLEGICKTYGVQVLLSEFTVSDLTEPFRLRELDVMRVKGKEQPVAIYEALDYHTPETFPNMDDTLQSYARGLRSYRERNWNEAIQNFDAALLAHPHDKPSTIMRSRAVHFLKEPPSADWDGVWVMKEK